MDELVALIRCRVKSAPVKPQLRVVELPPKRPPGLDSVTRESHIKMIGHLRRSYGLQVLIDQATFGIGSLDRLGDDELVALHRDMESGRDCCIDGVSLEDAGLIRPQFGSKTL